MQTPPPPPPPRISSCRIIWSTQSGRAKACARRTARIIGEKNILKLEDGIGSPFDETPVPFLELLTSHHVDSNTGTLFLMFVSTTGDGEQCDSIRNTWVSLLQKSLPKNMLAGSKHQFALFCLGDRAYGPQFCAAGRKLAVRLLQLGIPSFCEVGYGDDNTPNGGVFRDLDEWLMGILLPGILESSTSFTSLNAERIDQSTVFKPSTETCPYRVRIIREGVENGINPNFVCEDRSNRPDHYEMEEETKLNEWETEFFEDSYRAYFSERAPITAYSYDYSRGERVINATAAQKGTGKSPPLTGTVVINQRITDADWEQDTRHIEIEVRRPDPLSRDVNDAGTVDENFSTSNDAMKDDSYQLPYLAGDVASVLPFNSRQTVNKFLSVLPKSISSVADSTIRIDLEESYATDNRYTKWPSRCTLRGWLTYCADIQSLPEREDLRALSVYCAPSDGTVDKDSSLSQSKKLRSLSETSEAALYADYILREKRSWIDVLYDFESLREPGSHLTLEALFMIIPPIRTRDFSIASAPSMGNILKKLEGIDENRTNLTKLCSIELCVALVEGKTRLGRSYHGLCSKFLSQTSPLQSAVVATNEAISPRSSRILMWIRPGTFGKTPMQLKSHLSFEVPIICVGAGTGIAPMRSLILERVALRFLARKKGEDPISNDSKSNGEDVRSTLHVVENENILVFGCRKQSVDYYYKKEWEALTQEGSIRLLTAFSQEQAQKIYVQKVLREADDGALIAKHILERGGAVYIAGNPKMARAVKQEISEVLSDILPGGGKQAGKILNKMQRMGRFSIEAWS